MSGPVTVVTVAYKCETCGKFARAVSMFAADKPEGFYLNLRRVTDAGNHYLSGDVYVCSKTCLIDYTQYGISASVTPFRPIGKAIK